MNDYSALQESSGCSSPIPDLSLAGSGDVQLQYYIPFYIPDQEFTEIIAGFQNHTYSETHGEKEYKKPVWTKVCFPFRDDSRLYDHFLNLMNVRANENAICCTWKYNRSLMKPFDADGLRITSPFLFEHQGLSVDFLISSVYVHLFATCIGFLSFEITVDRDMLGNDVQHLFVFQNFLKKIAYGENSNPVYSLLGIQSFPMRPGEDNLPESLFRDKIRKDLPESASLYFKRDQKHGKFIFYQKNHLRLGVMFSEMLRGTNDHILFFESSRENTMPEQALLSSYLVYNHADAASLKEAAYRLARGYDQKYLISEKMLEACPMLFDNVYYCNASEGSSVAVRHSEINEGFFVRNLEIPRRTYGLIYLFVLYQHYSLVYFTLKVSKELPSDTGNYLLSSGYADKMEKLIVDINAFLMKSDLATISSIQHHNQFYANCRAALNIQADQQSLHNGFEYLESIQTGIRRREREEALRAEKEAAEIRWHQEQLAQQKAIDETNRHWQEQEQHWHDESAVHQKEKEEAEKQQEEERKKQEAKDSRINWLLTIITLITFVSGGYDSIEKMAELYQKCISGHLGMRDWAFIITIICLIAFFLLVSRRKKHR